MTTSPFAPADSASPTLSPRPPMRGPVSFLGAEETDPDNGLPMSSPLEQTTDLDDLEEQFASDSGSPTDETEDDESAPTSSRASSRGNALGKAALKAATIKGVLIGGEMAHRAAARTQGQQEVGLFRTDEEDAENIGDPLAELIHRRGGIAGAAAAANPDVGDAIRMMMGLANFASKQIAGAMQAREIDQALATGARPHDVQ